MDELNLFTATARGGVVGGAGYNFQDAYIITALPAWLSDPAFRSFIKEGFEDVDVRFEEAGRTWTWHYQLKDHVVGVSEFREVLEGFTRVALGREVNASRFIVGCCGLDRRLTALWNQIQEFRGARRAHPEPVLRSTRGALLDAIMALNLGNRADFIIDNVEIEHDNPALRDTVPIGLLERFRGRFITLPLYRGEESAVLDRLFLALMVPINKAIRVGITRDQILCLVEEELGNAVKGRSVVVYLHGWTRQRYEVPADVELDWTPHFDHGTLRVAPPAVWDAELLPSLRALRARFDSGDHRRCIWLRARAPLSAGLAFGHAFAEAAGYTIVVQQPSPGLPSGIQYLRTDSAESPAGQLDVCEIEGDSASDEIAVGIGLTDNPRPKIEGYLRRAGLTVRGTLYLYPDGGPSATSVTEQNAGAIAGALKRELRRMVDRHAARLVHLFYLGPLGLAVLLGQKLNGLADIQCYERDKTDGYAPSCRLPA